MCTTLAVAWPLCRLEAMLVLELLGDKQGLRHFNMAIFQIPLEFVTVGGGAAGYHAP